MTGNQLEVSSGMLLAGKYDSGSDSCKELIRCTDAFDKRRKRNGEGFFAGNVVLCHCVQELRGLIVT